MTFRAPLLELLRAPGYHPLTDAALFRALKLPKNLRHRFLHELRLLLSRGEIAQIHGDRYALPAHAPAALGNQRPAPSVLPPHPSATLPSANPTRRPAPPALPDDAITGRIQFRQWPVQQDLETWNDFWSEYKGA